VTPTISILMSAYNRERYVAEAVKSVLAQTRGDFELIVRDDGSTDGTLDAIRAAADEDPRVRVMTGANLGVCGSLNLAAAEARGRYIGWVDSDDSLAPAALEETAKVLDAEPSVGLAYTSYVVIDEHGKMVGPGKRCAVPYSPQRLLVEFMTFHFRLMRRALFDRVGGVDARFVHAEDYDLCLKLSEITKFRHVDKPLYAYRVHPQSVSQERRVQQIYASRDAINAALRRRGLDATHELQVQIVGRLQVRRKPNPGNQAPA
jgi:glycosyltransferase involved in cell wall biosynthesis